MLVVLVVLLVPASSSAGVAAEDDLVKDLLAAGVPAKSTTSVLQIFRHYCRVIRAVGDDHGAGRTGECGSGVAARGRSQGTHSAERI